MNLNPTVILISISILLLVSVLASKTSSRTGLPMLAIFLVIGILAGTEGIGKITFNNPVTAQFLGIIALCFILFSGGLDTRFEHVKPIAWKGIVLATVGVFITAITLGLFVYWVTNYSSFGARILGSTKFSLFEAFLLGSIVSSTDAAAVFAIFRSKNTSLKRNLRPILELESGSNDPMAYFLTITFITLIQSSDASIWVMIPKFLKGMTLGAIMGFVIGKITIFVINKSNLKVDGLYPVLTIAMMLFSYSFTELIGGNGFLSIYISGLIVGNSNFIHKRSLLKFYDGFAWLMQILMFITLGLLVFPSKMTPIIGIAILISIFLILVARPIAMLLCLLPFKVYYKDLTFISWVGLKGAVPIIFATYPMVEKIPNAEVIFHIVFFITLTSLLLQGTTLFNAAKLLKLTMPDKKARKPILEFDSESIKSVLDEIVVKHNFKCVNNSIVDMKLPRTALIVMIERDDKFFTPNGSTIIEIDDRLTVLADSKTNLEITFNALK